MNDDLTVYAYKFSINLLLYLTRGYSLRWQPVLVRFPLELMSRSESNYLRIYIRIVGRAVDIITSRELADHRQEFQLMAEHLGNSLGEFRSVFASSIRYSFFDTYSSFNFIRYLSYVTSFSIYCYQRGYTFAPDYAVYAISDVILSEHHIFIQFQSWCELLLEASCLNAHNFQHPYIIRCRSFR